MGGRFEAGDCCRTAPVRPQRAVDSLWVTAPGVVALALIPKCPACLMAYGSVFAAAGVSRFVVGPLVTVLMVLSAAALFGYALMRRNPILAITGSLALASIYWLGRERGLPWGNWLGVALLAGGYLHDYVRSRRRVLANAGER